MVVHGSRHVSGSSYLVLGGEHAGGGEEERCGRGCAQLEVEGAVGADGYACGDGGAGGVVGGAGVELLVGVSISVGFAMIEGISRACEQT